MATSARSPRRTSTSPSKRGRFALAAVVVIAIVAGCRGDRVGAGIPALSAECALAADILFSLRFGAGDYDRKEADKRTQETYDDLEKSCSSSSKKTECCDAAKRLKTRLANRPLANCNAFFTRVGDDGCAGL